MVIGHMFVYSCFSMVSAGFPTLERSYVSSRFLGTVTLQYRLQTS
jgi:hypothetical protein